MTTQSADETIACGRQIASLLQNRDVVSLSGPLGAGKTCLIRGLAIGLGLDEDTVKSPSFTLINEYHGDRSLYHFDLYRMNDPSELYQIGWDDYLLRDGIVVVEWGEKAAGYLPETTIDITIEIISETTRELRLEFAR
ncbi:MAG: tRNA (adenosine(37)-N6)-threonylcarbamoyltransferase complex ATPase subunit type 1 TsaE [Candidatus Zixiibacteriota bacterium]|nr:MAG: tRNA (adenosine(37)-N6)-threonylcarbamoyltransferase complex ATPase subunit type 1 TsaE [candidate division Zixibacteria bacterium]